jgi:8-oxo-dGTP pyrophosphatase MutT (NUDIX family)
MGVRKLVQALLKVGAGPYRDRADVYMRLPDGRIFGGRWRDGGFAVPGGGVEPGEDPAQAAVREALEESGYAATDPKVLDVPPTVRDWSPEHLAKLSSEKKLFAGSRTHYVTARLAGETQAKKKNLDKWEATQRGFYTPQEALNIHNEALTPYSKPHWEATQKVLQRFLNESVLPNNTVKTDGTGQIAESAAKAIDAEVTAKLKRAVLRAPNDFVTSVAARVVRTNNVLSTGILQCAISIVPRGSINAVTTTISYTLTAASDA